MLSNIHVGLYFFNENIPLAQEFKADGSVLT